MKTKICNLSIIILTVLSLVVATKPCYAYYGEGGVMASTGTKVALGAIGVLGGIAGLALAFSGGGNSSDSITPIAPIAPEAPVITKIYPVAGPISGGTNVTIQGTGFTNASTVKFGNISATKVTYNSATSITATSPGVTSVGSVNLTVTTLGGTSAALAYTYNQNAGIISGDSKGKMYLDGESIGSSSYTSISSVIADYFGNIYAGGIFSNSPLVSQIKKGTNNWDIYMMIGLYGYLKIKSMETDVRNNIYVGYASGQVWVKGPDFTIRKLGNSLDGSVNALTVHEVDENNTSLYAGTDNGKIWVYNTKGVISSDWEEVSLNSVLDNSSVNTLTVDKNGILYAGNSNGNVYSYSESVWTNLSSPSSGFSSVNTLVPISSPNQNLYLCAGLSDNKVVCRGDSGTWRELGKQTPLPGSVLTLAAEPLYGDLYAGSNNTVYKYNIVNDRWDTYFTVQSDAIITSIDNYIY